jgi:hypothetical protein
MIEWVVIVLEVVPNGKPNTVSKVQQRSKMTAPAVIFPLVSRCS